MAQGRRKEEWYRTAFATCAIANSFRSKRTAIKLGNFPYCQTEEKIRMATKTECKTFAENFFKR